MKKKVQLLAALFLVIVLNFQSCEKEEGKIVGELDRTIWTAEQGGDLVKGVTEPAVDENGNIYIAYYKSVNKLAKFDPLGEKLWSKDYKISPVYIDQKLFGFDKDNNVLYRINPIDGSEVWKIEDDTLGNSLINIAVTSEKIYVLRFQDNWIQYLCSYDHDGVLLNSQKLTVEGQEATFFGPEAMSIRDNQVYIASFESANLSDTPFVILNYIDEGNALTKGWMWSAPIGFTTEVSFFKDIAIDDNNNLVFGLNNSGTPTVFSINSEGVENWHQATSMTKTIRNITVDKDGMCYVSEEKCEKIGLDGVVWTSTPKAGWSFDEIITVGPNIDQDGNLTYNNRSPLLTSLSPQGDLLWEQFYPQCSSCEGTFYRSIIAPNGDVILAGPEIRAITGNGQGLAQKGWPKLHGNYGNTSSK